MILTQTEQINLKSPAPPFIKLVYRLTKSFEKLSSGKLPIKEQCIIYGVIGPTHADQKNVHAACGQKIQKLF